MSGTTPQSAIDNWGEQPAIVMPRVKITQAVLDAAREGRGALANVRAVRAILEAAGLEVEPHPVELEEIERLRASGAGMLKAADDLEKLIRGRAQ